MGIIMIIVLGSVLGACSSGPVEISPSNRLGAHLPQPIHGGPLTQYPTAEEQTPGAKTDALETTLSFTDVYGYTAPPSPGSFLLPEWAEGASILVAWYEPLRDYFAPLVIALSLREPVWLLTESTAQSDTLRRQLADAGARVDNIRFFEYLHEAFWTRDFGPWSLVGPRGNVSFFDPKYYPTRYRDDATPPLLAEYYGLDVVRPRLSAEGGNMMANGSGLCVTTTRLTYNNPPLFSFQLNERLERWLGCRRTVYLEPLDGERTGHIDVFAKFLGPDVVVVAQYDPVADPANARIADDAAKTLGEVRLADDRPLTILRVPTPATQPGLYRSYTNALLTSRAIYVPTYTGAAAFNEGALGVYRAHFSGDIEVVPIDATQLIELGGAIHCSTMQVHLEAAPTTLDPAFVPQSWRPPDDAVAIVANTVVPKGESRTFELVGRLRSNTDTLGAVTVHVDLEGRASDQVTLTIANGDTSVLLFDGQANRGRVRLPAAFETEGFEGRLENGPWRLSVSVPRGSVFSVGVRHAYVTHR
ncbi:MAG: agmatine deiminase family protein [Myxococcota bacterium]|nr:agmatine deiminase family protein [Myxococcota bacterium]